MTVPKATTSFNAIRLRRRPDLVAKPQRVGLFRRWALKDPLALNYFHLGEEEWYLLKQLDGKTSLAEIKTRFDKRFAPRRVSHHRLMAFFQQLHENGMLLADRSGQGQVLYDRSVRLRRRRWQSVLLSPLAIRFHGVDADGLLQRIYPWFRFVFHPLFAAWLLGLWIAAAVLLIAQSGQLARRLPTLSDFFVGDNLLLLLVTLSLVKILHELGHGLACHHFGSECHEIGFMLLAFSPCLYCNVSDAWMMPNKWHRILTSAAGIYVELILAGSCVFLWYFSAPGILNSLCLNVVLICSVSTILVNGNPLLRYDGYFILADLTDTPNLFEQSRTALWGPLQRWLAGSRQHPASQHLPGRWLILYGLCSAVYRLFVIGIILWVLYRGLSAQRLRPLADLLVVVTFVGLLASPAMAMVRIIKAHSVAAPIRWSRWSALALLVAAVTSVLFVIPAPRYLRVPMVLEASGARYLYAPFDGRLTYAVPLGSRVAQGDLVARLQNQELRRELIQAQGETKQWRRHLLNLQFRANEDAAARAEIPTAETTVKAAEQREVTLNNSNQRLLIRAPIDGVVIPAPHRAEPIDSEDTELPLWTGTPLDEDNRGCQLTAGDLLCLVGDPTQLEAILLLRADQVDLVSEGCQVYLHVDQLPGKVLSGEVGEISQREIPLIAAAPAAADRLGVQLDPGGLPRPLKKSYSARVSLAQTAVGARHGSAGLAKIVVRWEPVGMRIVKFVKRTFRFQL